MYSGLCKGLNPAPRGGRAERAGRMPPEESEWGRVAVTHHESLMRHHGSPMRRLVEEGQGLLEAVAGARLHDQVLPNTTFAEAWSAGAAGFFVSPQDVAVRTQPAALPHALCVAGAPGERLARSAARKRCRWPASARSWQPGRGAGATRGCEHVAGNGEGVRVRMQALEARGHAVVPTAWSAVVQGVLVDPVDATLTAVSDPRKDGAPAGY